MAKLKTERELIQTYVAALREEDTLREAAELADARYRDARVTRQNAWREVARLLNDGTIAEGVYRVGPHALTLEKSVDYPDIMEVFEL